MESVLSTRSLSHLSTAELITTAASPLTPKPHPSPSPLMKLPLELREKIYGYVLTTDQPFIWPNDHSQLHVHPQLLAVSHQVFHEAAPILYATNKFMFSHPSDLNMFRHIMSPQHTPQMTNVCLRIRDRDVRTLWSGYLSSTQPSRSLQADAPRLRILWVFYRSVSWPAHTDPVENYRLWQCDVRLREVCQSLDVTVGARGADIKVIAIHRVSRTHWDTLTREFRDDLHIDPEGDARTEFLRLGEMKKVLVALELSCPMEERMH